MQNRFSLNFLTKKDVVFLLPDTLGSPQNILVVTICLKTILSRHSVAICWFQGFLRLLPVLRNSTRQLVQRRVGSCYDRQK